VKDEIDQLLNTMLSASFRQGMAAQRHEDATRAINQAQSEMNDEAQTVMGSVHDFYKILNIPLGKEEKEKVN
jgi:hypothetical protein